MRQHDVVWTVDPAGFVAQGDAVASLRAGFAVFLTEKEAWAAAATLLDQAALDAQAAATAATQAANDARAKANKP